ncbi:hypothetical protein E2F50_20805 [Rhizobium deserti]|uniref:Uncharacterized protein n=1 Tax=Rhizobium deserti TaxID=2547961 RepID=A0A4R5U872_9HYPH|nr:hypothetical protein [Rhizobium deserti]TDK30282.1 hypothetical protein E2F50_20805 [Rhizobium deserti]
MLMCWLSHILLHLHKNMTIAGGQRMAALGLLLPIIPYKSSFCAPSFGHQRDIEHDAVAVLIATDFEVCLRVLIRERYWSAILPVSAAGLD